MAPFRRRGKNAAIKFDALKKSLSSRENRGMTTRSTNLAILIPCEENPRVRASQSSVSSQQESAESSPRIAQSDTATVIRTSDNSDESE